VEARTERIDARVVEGETVVADFHAVTFRELRPDTLYAYRVGDGERWSEWFQFRTPSDEPEPFSFIYFGDAQNDILPLWSRAVRASVREAPDALFMLHAGDLVNRAHRNTEWGEWFEAGSFLHATISSIPSPGNHEHDPYTAEEEARDVDRLSIYWQPQFTLPENGPPGIDGETAYWIDVQGVRIVSLNSSADPEAQTAWLDEVLSSNEQPWTVVTHHHPVFSASEGRDNEELRAAWKPVYDRHGVDLVLQGHDHTYARGRTFAAAENVPTGVNLRDDESGTVYVVSVSGRKMYGLKPDGWEGYEVERDRAAENTQLFQVIRVDGDRLSYEAFTPTGELYDAFDLVRQEGRPNRFVDRRPEGEGYRFDGTDAYTW
jgi:3',5'-cyclic AMP phosphodiesterase CpdA